MERLGRGCQMCIRMLWLMFPLSYRASTTPVEMGSVGHYILGCRN